MRPLAVRRATLYGWLAVAFLLLNATNFGPYSSRFGPYYLLAMLLILAMFHVLRRGDLMLLVSNGDIAFGLAIFGALFVAAVVSLNGQTLELSRPMFSDLVAYALAAFVVSKTSGTEWFGRGLLCSILVVSAVNVYEFFLEPSGFSVAPGRAAGFFVNPNESGTSLAGLIALWLAGRTGRIRLNDIVIFAVAFAGIALTFSRGALLVLTLCAGTVIYMRARSANASVRTLFAFSTVLALFSALSVGVFQGLDLSRDAALRLDSLLQSDFRDDSSTARRLALEHHALLFAQNPMAGAGPFQSLFSKEGAGPHNAYIAAAADFGLFGLLAFLLIFFRGIRRARALHWTGATAQRFVAVLIWLGIASLFSHNILYNAFGAMMIGFLLGKPERLIGVDRIAPDGA